jgi:hypothetical protein
MNLSGTWEGYYYNNWNGREFRAIDDSDALAFAIKLEISQEGNSINGSMIDLRPAYEMSAQDQYRLLLPAMTWFQKVQTKLVLFLLKDVVIKSELPQASTVEGFLREREVVFTKIYQGQITTTMIAKGKETSQKRDLIPIRYSGVVSEDNTFLEGHFHILEKGVPSKHAKGQFRLRRTLR